MLISCSLCCLSWQCGRERGAPRSGRKLVQADAAGKSADALPKVDDYFVPSAKLPKSSFIHGNYYRLDRGALKTSRVILRCMTFGNPMREGSPGFSPRKRH